MQMDFFETLKQLVATVDVLALHPTAPFETLHTFDYGLRDALDPHFDWTDCGNVLLQTIPQSTLILSADTFGVNYAMFRIPGEEKAFYIIGPWTHGEQTDARRDWINTYLPPEAAAATKEYYSGVRQLSETELSLLVGAILALLRALNPPEKFRAERRTEFRPLNFRPDTKDFEAPAFRDEIPLALLEQRYAIENELLDCVARGDETGALEKMRNMQRFDYGGRFTGSLYAMKNKLVIFNTLLRKTIEKGQVNPYYIDRISARYSAQIENMTEADVRDLTYEMLRDYCAYVQRYSMKEYSPLIRKVITHINLFMEKDLSLKALAAMCHISPSYLSTLFKQETGHTLNSYVNEQRIRRAEQLLRTTDLSIAAVAEQVGILDVNYFTKMFKNSGGLTPTQYRRQARSE